MFGVDKVKLAEGKGLADINKAIAQMRELGYEVEIKFESVNLLGTDLTPIDNYLEA